MERPDVLLVAPPTDLANVPSLAIGLLSAALRGRQISCQAIYTSRMFLDAVGVERVQALSAGRLNSLIWEGLFAPFAHGGLPAIRAEMLGGAELPEGHREYHRILGTLGADISDALLREAQERCGRFLRSCLEEILRLHPRILGFSNSFLTTNAAIAIGREVKRRLPEVLYVVGGSNCEGPMGEELARAVAEIDFVFQGDADQVFPEFCADYLRDGSRPPEKLIRCPPTQDLDRLPVPEFEDFFVQQAGDQLPVMLPFEGSRGCWWGQKRRCKFCGETQGDLRYRVKSPQRMLRELFRLKAAHPEAAAFFAADALFPDAYLEEVLPRLAEESFDRKLVCETRAHLSLQAIAAMKQCGMDRILVGIESLSSRLLKILDKGTTALTNLKLLRNCREVGVAVSWVLLTGIPGDEAEDYESQLRLLPWIEHLMPPDVSPLRLQRFSPFFEEPKRHGITRLQPLPMYRHVFPEGMDRTRLAYYFTGEYPSAVRTDPALLARFVAGVRRWQERWRGAPVPRLSVRPIAEETWEVRDTRSCATSPSRVLDAEEYGLLRRCREGLVASDAGEDPAVLRLLGYGYLVRIDGRLLSLVCESSPGDGAG